MVQINLLPPSGKKKGRPKVELNIRLGPVIFAMGAVLLAIIVAWSVLGMGLSTHKKKLSRLEGQLKALKSNLKKVDKLKRDKQELSSKLEFLDQSIKREILWARNLNQLSDLMPAGVWLNNLTLRSTKKAGMQEYLSLDITGMAISLHGKEMIDSIGEFMTAIKKDEVFVEQFAKIKLISSERSKSGRIERMTFKLLCQFE